MIAEQKRHGYELMKAIEERMNGSYSPSPGVMYPTLAWLEDMGYASVEAEGGRKRYAVTPEGASFLSANRVAVEDLFARMGPPGSGAPDGVPAPIARAMENVKLALRLRLRRGPVAAEEAARIAAALDAAALEAELNAK
jgi:DNA-binding PadR family transcriptional regulator